jgi:hypothetical protein
MNGRTKRLNGKLEEVERLTGGDGYCPHSWAPPARPSILAFTSEPEAAEESDEILICWQCGLPKRARPRIVPAGPDWKAPEDRRVGGDDD